jgi:hypothetical protein
MACCIFCRGLSLWSLLSFHVPARFGFALDCAAGWLPPEPEPSLDACARATCVGTINSAAVKTAAHIRKSRCPANLIFRAITFVTSLSANANLLIDDIGPSPSFPDVHDLRRFLRPIRYTESIPRPAARSSRE